MSKWKNNKVDECFVKDSTNARMAFINTFKGCPETQGQGASGEVREAVGLA